MYFIVIAIHLYFEQENFQAFFKMFQDFNSCASALFVSIFHLYEAGIADANISIYGKYIFKIELFCEQTIL